VFRTARLLIAQIQHPLWWLRCRILAHRGRGGLRQAWVSSWILSVEFSVTGTCLGRCDRQSTLAGALHDVEAQKLTGMPSHCETIRMEPQGISPFGIPLVSSATTL
jgi:hypothetical protein